MPNRPSTLPVSGPVLLPTLAEPLSLPISTPRPRVLIVTPEIASAPAGLSPRAHQLTAKAGGLADVSASLVRGLQDRGAQVHLAVPNYRRLFDSDADSSFKDGLAESAAAETDRRVHLAEDRAFYYRSHIYGGPEGHLAAIAFQREVINNIITRVRPDLIHCHDWMTGLIPALAKKHGIPCLFTVHNIHTERFTLEALEDRGIDTACFWQNLFFERHPQNYHETRRDNACDLLASGILASDHVNVVSPNFLTELLHGHHECVPASVRSALRHKDEAKQASGIINSPDSSYDPASDSALRLNYTPGDVEDGKTANKVSFQRRLGLNIDPDAPLLFWPSRLDPVQKGCQLLTDILDQITRDYEHLGLQIVAVADGPYQCHLHEIIQGHGLQKRVASVEFEEGLSRQGFAASDFVLMPSLFEPCGLPQMIGPKYGALPIARNTGGIHDTIQQLDADQHQGNGFLFDHYDTAGFRWAIDQALTFYQRPRWERIAEIRRVMSQANETFNDEVMTTSYFDLYEQILERPLTSSAIDRSKTLTSPLPVPPSFSDSDPCPATFSVAV